MGLREKAVTLYSATPLVTLATSVGITLGLAEAIRVLFSVRSITALELALLFTYGIIGHALVSVIAAILYIIAIRIFRLERYGSLTAASGVGITVAAFSSIYFMWALTRDLAWLIPCCICTAVVIGMIATWIASRISLLQKPSFWSAANVALVVVGFALVVRKQEGSGFLVWYLAGVIGVLLSILFLKIPSDKRLWMRPALNNACLLILICLMPAAVSALDSARDSVRSNDKRPNVLLISVDTLRSDRLGCYGYARARTPVIDAFSKESALFEQATSPLPYTGPSHTSMLTGLYPVHHGTLVNGTPLKDGAVTIADLFSGEGYRSAAFISGYTLKDAACGLASRFNYYDEDFSRWSILPEVVLKLHLLQHFTTVGSMLGYYQEPLERAAEPTTDRVLSWLSHNRDKPFFLFVHYFDAHSPHSPPPPYDKMHDPDYHGDPTLLRDFQPGEMRLRILSDSRYVEHLKALYDGEISYVDTQIGRLLKALRELELAEDTLVIFTADHGESLTEHNFFFNHGHYLYETCVRVPLIIRFPDRRYAGVRKNNQVRLVDLAPTILEITGTKGKLTYDGHSLLPVLTASEKQERVSFGSTHFQKRHDSRSRYYVREKGYKLIWNFDEREPFSSHPVFEELYDLNVDGGELNNLIFQQPQVLEILRKDLGSWIQHWPSKTEGLSEEVKERLRALGYL